jgi:hypothetical protein
MSVTPNEILSRLPTPFPWHDLRSVSSHIYEMQRTEDGSCPDHYYTVHWCFKSMHKFGTLIELNTGGNEAGSKNADNVVKAMWEKMPDEYKQTFEITFSDIEGWIIRRLSG